MRLYITTLLLLAVYSLYSQSYLSANWPFGLNEYPTGPYGNAILQFSNGAVTPVLADLRMNFESTSAAISDSTGALLFYTNGCYIACANGDTMSNGVGLNPGEVHDWVCPQNGYISERGATAIPVPGSSTQYYLFHLGLRYDPYRKLEYGPLYRTTIDMALANGKGAVTEKNTVLLDGRLEPYAIVRHGNGRDWWLVIPEYHSNRYHRILIQQSGTTTLPPLTLGPVGSCGRIGSTAFSPDGSRYARVQNCRTIVFNFERCSGELSGIRVFQRLEEVFGGGGAAFTRDGRHLFITEQLAILSADLTSVNPKLDTITLLDSVAGTSMRFMQYGLDGNIYLNLTHRGRYMPVLTGIETSPIFKRRGRLLPVQNARTLPHFPNFNLQDLTGSSCDTLGITSSVSQLPESISLQISPNPFTTYLNIQCNANDILQHFILSDAQAKQVLNVQINSPDSSLDVSDLPAGVYFYQAYFEKSPSVYGKLIKR
jgi:Secretion system C-terminal sorting domain